MALSEQKYLRFTTTRRDGTEVGTPVWVVPLPGGRAGFYTSSTSGKVKRLARTPRATVQPCDQRGRPTPGTTPVAVDVQLVTGAELAAIHSAVRAKYGSVFPAVAKVLGAIGGLVKRKPQPYGDLGVTFTDR